MVVVIVALAPAPRGSAPPWSSRPWRRP